MAVDLSIYAHRIPFGFQENCYISNSVLLYGRAWKSMANPRFSMGFTKMMQACNWKRSPCLKWRHKAVKNGFENGHEFESVSKIDVDRLLSVAEVVCIAPSLVLSVGFAVQSTFQKSQNVNSVTSTVPVNKHADMYITWQIVPLLGALIIGAIIRTRQWQAITRVSKESGKVGSSDLSLIQRVKKLEEDVGSSVTIVRVLSRQLEKLGVRFRVTRQTLRDPINETAALAQKASEAVRVLAIQEDALEKELHAIQHILLAMQEQQEKQLELLLTLANVGKLREKAAHSFVQRTEKPDDSRDYTGTQVSKLNGLKENITKKNLVKENSSSDVHRDHGKLIVDRQQLPSASKSQLSRKIDRSKSLKVNSSYNDQVNTTETQILSSTGRAEMNLSEVPGVQGTVQDIRLKSDFVASNSQDKDDDFRSNTKEKISGEGSGF